MPVEVRGAVNLRKALRTFTPDLAKETQKEMAAALKPVVKNARGFIPTNTQIISNWLPRENSQGTFPTYDATIAKRGIGYKTTPSRPNRQGFRSLARLFNKSAAGAIYETAGRKKPDSTFVRNINSKYGTPLAGSGKMRGRALFKAFEADRGAAQNGVLRAIEKATILFNQRSKVVR